MQNKLKCKNRRWLADGSKLGKVWLLAPYSTDTEADPAPWSVK